MTTVYTYYKNSNTGEILFTQEFKETDIKGIPIFFFNFKRESIETKNLTGFVEISEKTFNRCAKKLTKNIGQ